MDNNRIIALQEENEEVLCVTKDIIAIDHNTIAFLKKKSESSIRGRVRICVHKGLDDTVHEMLIALSHENYIPPHKHINKSESFHMIDGLMDVVLFYDDGSILDIISMGTSNNVPTKNFYYRLNKNIFHSLIIRSDIVVFHETTTGPFRKGDMVCPQWAPTDKSDLHVISEYTSLLNINVNKWVKDHQ